MDRSEILALRWGDVDATAGVVFAPRSKTGKPRQIPINATMSKILARAQKVRSVQSDHVFLGRKGQPLTMDAANCALKRAYRKAGLKAAPWKTLRHTFGSRLAMAGVPAVTIARLMGHTTTAITDRYMHLSPSHLRDAMTRLDDPDGTMVAPTAKKGADALSRQSG